MTIAPTLRRYLDRQHAVYELVDHPPTLSAAETARVAHVPASCIAKAVLLELPQQAHDHLLAVLAANRRIDLDDLRIELDQKPRLASEGEVEQVFNDCAPGAVPVGFGYRVPMIVDDVLVREPDLFFEGGDHRTLIHMEQAEFRRLLAQARHGSFGMLALDA